MARWGTKGRSGGSELRALMTARACELREFWRDAKPGSEVERCSTAIIERWEHGEPMSVGGWEIPDALERGLRVDVRYVIDADGNVEPEQPTPGLRVIKGGRR